MIIRKNLLGLHVGIVAITKSGTLAKNVVNAQKNNEDCGNVGLTVNCSVPTRELQVRNEA